ncbi:MAG: DUF4445 domain-containing protein [Fimbriimonadaceae bacterium]|nr:DUF4445 domain-containing protein [Fimbriimonadaceae bacterium]
MRIVVELPNDEVTILPDRALAHRPLSEILRRKSVALNTRCGQKGQCNGCKVELLEGQVEPMPESGTTFAACQCRALGDVRIRVPHRSLVDYEPQVLGDYRIGVGLADEPLYPGLAAAVDVGTTTIVVQLVENGETVAEASAFNAQMRLGDDVLTRINLCSTDGSMLGELQDAVAGTIRSLVQECLAELARPTADLLGYAIAGNTTMLHLLAGVNPRSLGVAPFTPEFLETRTLAASEVGLEPSNADVTLLPGAAAYVGADLTAGVFASGLLYDDGPSLLVDIGTNGEIILKEGDDLFGCATAAGPAFEGSGLSCGMRAGRGAVAHLAFPADGSPAIEVIGGGDPEGLCGSAYVDLLAEGRRVGLLGPVGRIGPSAEKVEVHAGVRAIRIGTGRGQSPIVVTEFDVAALLQAKAAIAAGIETLLSKAGIRASDLRNVYVAGGFGMHLNLDHAIACGLLPGLAREKLILVGNTSLGGAFATLVDQTCLSEIARVGRDMTIVELNREPGFEDAFIDHLSLP